jgi:hypothetical protein
MVNVAWLWQPSIFFALVWALMTFEDPFRIALCAAMLGLIGPVRRAILTLDDPGAAARVRP